MKPFDITISGQALESQGFVGLGFTIDGLGLLTFGFVWTCSQIWSPNDPLISTSWTNADPVVTTTWTEYNPNGSVEYCLS